MNYRKGASAFIINNKKEFLMALAVKKNPTDPDYWKIPAGGIEENETQEEGLYREMNEELGLERSDFTIIAKSKFVDKYTWPKEVSERKFKKTGIWYDGQERCVFICKLTNPNFKFKLQEEEVADVKWFNKNNYKPIILFPIQVEFMQNVIAEFKEYF